LYSFISQGSLKQIIASCLRAMKTDKDLSRPKQSEQPTDEHRKKPYRAPAVTVLTPGEAKAKLARMALVGDRDAEKLLRLVS